jgi:hypothetical protein
MATCILIGSPHFLAEIREGAGHGPTGPNALEPLSGMAHFNGLLVTLERTGVSRVAESGV